MQRDPKVNPQGRRVGREPSSGRDVESDVEVGIFTGRVERSDAYIAIAAARNEVLAYVTDGRKLVADEKTISEWFRAGRSGNEVDAKSDTGASIRAALSRRGATGTVTSAGGSPLQFRAEPTRGDAGLYRAQGTIEGVEMVAGLIALNDGTFRSSSSLHEDQCRQLKNRLNQIFVKVFTGDFTFEDLEVGAHINRTILNMGC